MSKRFKYNTGPLYDGGSPRGMALGTHEFGVYQKETVQRFVPGTRFTTWDGRVFRYAKCGHADITDNKFGAANWTVLIAHKIAVAGLTNAVTMQDALVGDTSIRVTFDAGSLGNVESNSDADKTGVVAEDELCGGFIHIYTGSYRQNRAIIGNTESTTSSTSMILYLEAPLEHVITFGASYSEILSNPYAQVGHTDDAYVSIMGMPNVTAAIGEYLWLQTWGPVRITGVVTTLGIDPFQRQYVFTSNGAVTKAGEWYGGSYSHQHAGFLIERTGGAVVANWSAAPFIMLQLSP